MQIKSGLVINVSGDKVVVRSPNATFALYLEEFDDVIDFLRNARPIIKANIKENRQKAILALEAQIQMLKDAIVSDEANVTPV